MWLPLTMNVWFLSVYLFIDIWTFERRRACSATAETFLFYSSENDKNFVVPVRFHFGLLFSRKKVTSSWVWNKKSMFLSDNFVWGSRSVSCGSGLEARAQVLWSLYNLKHDSRKKMFFCVAAADRSFPSQQILFNWSVFQHRYAECGR